VSARAHQEVDKLLQLEEAANADACVVVVQLARDVSAAVAQKTGIKHESPQVLLIRDGNCVWSVSHRMIDAAAIKEALKKHCS
jgi:bacillithiol system protein YtxJ